MAVLAPRLVPWCMLSPLWDGLDHGLEVNQETSSIDIHTCIRYGSPIESFPYISRIIVIRVRMNEWTSD